MYVAVAVAFVAVMLPVACFTMLLCCKCAEVYLSAAAAAPHQNPPVCVCEGHLEALRVAPWEAHLFVHTGVHKAQAATVSALLRTNAVSAVMSEHVHLSGWLLLQIDTLPHH